MPPRKFCEASFFLIDLHSKNLDELRRSASRIIGYKSLIKTQSKNLDVIKLGFVGSDTKENSLDYNNINIVSDWQYFQLDTIKDIYDEVTGASPGSIFEALYLAAFSLENDLIVKTNAPKSIVLFSDLSTESSHTPQEISKLKTFLKNSDIYLYVIGVDVITPRLSMMEDIQIWSHSTELEDPSEPTQTNFNAIKTILNEGVITDPSTGPHLYLVYKPVLKPPYPWYCDMSIGSKLSYKINMVKTLTDSGRLKFPGETKPPAQFNYVDIDNGEIVDDPVGAYVIQGETVVLSAEKEKMITEQQRMNEDKCFELSFFVNKSDISPLYYEGGTLSSLVADVRNSNQWESALDTLAIAMDKMGVVAFVKRVYAKGPQFSAMPYVMFTCQEHGPICLLVSKWPVEKDIVCPDAAVKSKNKPLKTENTDIKSAVNDYLTSLTVDDDKVLYPLSENLQRDPNIMNQIDFYIECLRKNNFEPYDPETNPKEDVEKPSRIVDELLMHPLLKERSEESLSKLNELVKKSTEDDDLQQCATS